MALKQLMINKKIVRSEEEIKALREELEGLNEEANALEKAIEEAETEEELEVVDGEVEAHQAKIEAKQAEIEAKETELADLHAELEVLNEAKPDNKREEIKKGDERMTGQMTNAELRDGLNKAVRAAKFDKNLMALEPEVRAQFTSVEGEVLIPKQLMATEIDTQEEFDLTKYVNVVQVNSSAGKYPLAKHSDGVMVSVAELAENPELEVPTFAETVFDIDTYRGYIPVSREVIDDAQYDVVGLITREIELQKQRTKNRKVIEAVKKMPAKSVATLDEVKTMFNIDISKDYTNVVALISSSLYNDLDLMKDSEGRYLIQPDVTKGTGKTLFGKEIIVVDDEIIGNAAGDKVGFFGDLKSAVVLFDRKQESIRWAEHNRYGEYLMGVVRFQTQVHDTDAGFYVTYTGGATQTPAV